MHGSCKVYKKCADGCPPFRPFYLLYEHLQACNCFGAILAITILEPLTTNRYEVKDSYNFATEIIDQDFSNFMGS